MKTIFKVVFAIIFAFVFLVNPAWATETGETSGITPSEYKLAKSISNSFCEAIEDGLSVKEALDYGVQQSMWGIIGNVLLSSLTTGKSEEEQSQLQMLDNTDELIERMTTKCLSKQQSSELHAYMTESANAA